MKNFVRNCRLCRKVMKCSPFTLCTTCIHETAQVWNFIKKTPLVTVKQISVATSVHYEKVERMIRLGSKPQPESRSIY